MRETYCIRTRVTANKRTREAYQLEEERGILQQDKRDSELEDERDLLQQDKGARQQEDERGIPTRGGERHTAAGC